MRADRLEGGRGGTRVAGREQEWVRHGIRERMRGGWSGLAVQGSQVIGYSEWAVGVVWTGLEKRPHKKRHTPIVCVPTCPPVCLPLSLFYLSELSFTRLPPCFIC